MLRSIVLFLFHPLRWETWVALGAMLLDLIVLYLFCEWAYHASRQPASATGGDSGPQMGGVAFVIFWGLTHLPLSIGYIYLVDGNTVREFAQAVGIHTAEAAFVLLSVLAVNTYLLVLLAAKLVNRLARAIFGNPSPG